MPSRIDPDIKRAALYMIKKHGGGAHAVSATKKRVLELDRERQTVAAELWRQIADAIVDLAQPGDD